MSNKEYFKKAAELIPGGVNSPLRGFNEVGGSPICISFGEGGNIYDVAGKKYVDFLLGFGPNILGHAPESVVEKVTETIKKGTVFAATNVYEIELAELVINSIPIVEKVRFVCSGTEAVMSALRLAKGYTAREKIMKFHGSYHGHADVVLGQDIDGGDERNPVKGVDKSIHENSVIVEYNNIKAVKEAFYKHGKEIACCIIEPYACNMGLVKPSKNFMVELKAICEEYGALLIFDEVITAFRMTYGSVYKDFEVVPDLITLGKVLGGGTPIGAYAGKSKYMDLLNDKDQGVYQSGTFAGNALSMAAGIAILKELSNKNVYVELEEKGALLEDLIKKGFKDNNIPYIFERKASVFSITFLEDGREIMCYRDVEEQNYEMFSAYHIEMLERGFLLPPAADEVMHLCTKHSENDIREFVKNTIEVLVKIRGEEKV